VTIDVRRATNRARIEQPGIVTWHSFSAGPHYDPNNISFGALIAHDEHLLAAAAGFPRHAHRGVDIVSWVLDGELRHNDQTIGVGTVLHQRTGDGIEHVEANARSDRSLRLVQMALLSSELTMPPSEERIDLRASRKHGVRLILQLTDAALYFARVSPRLPARVPSTGRAHLFITRGAARLGSGSSQGLRLAAGDAARITDEPELWLGTGTTTEALIWMLAN